MNRNEIGVNAGKVWQLLSNNEKWSYGLLKRKSGLKDKELGAALGWLSRESKIEFDQCDEELYVYPEIFALTIESYGVSCIVFVPAVGAGLLVVL